MSQLSELYRTRSLREVGEIVGHSHEQVRQQLIKQGVEIRPRGVRVTKHGTTKRTADLLYVGKPPDLLYKQGQCRVCGIPCFGYKAVPRDLCGEHGYVHKDSAA